MQAIPYFLQDTADLCNNNSINRLANTFTTIKQEENEAVITYLECFHRNLHQIQAIQADYFTVPQILNQFIRAAIFLFEFEKIIHIPLFSGATLDTKPIIIMYTNVKVDSHAIKLILDSRLAGSIITQQLINQLGHQVDHTASARIITTDETTKTPIGKIDDFSFEVNGIIIPIRVLVIEAT
ncbi:hypothetical protein G9A89_011274 [Geosiphon pyriformis]|nr:hypothetical protein G9A89_011274 [Geosiphon pyriformis]